MKDVCDLYSDQDKRYHILTCYFAEAKTEKDKEDRADLIQAIKDMMLRLLQDSPSLQKITLELVEGDIGDIIVLDRGMVA